MNLYIISQSVNHDPEAFITAVVRATSPQQARSIHPSGDEWGTPLTLAFKKYWCCPRDVEVEFIGETLNQNIGVVISHRGEGYLI